MVRLLWELLSIVFILSIAGTASAAPPVFDLYAGDVQSFGQLGNPQTWVNVIGEVTDPDGQGISSLSYTLNGGSAQALSVGPDTRRLYLPGEFNAEIAYTDLLDGANTVAITAIDGSGESTVQNVSLSYTAGQSWPRDFVADWSAVSAVTDAAQPVDGHWTLEPAGLRSPTVGYDRTIVIGDLDWTDYEVTVPITMHAVDPNGYVWPSVAPGIGFTSRWLGHTWLAPPEQPRVYWEPGGGTIWYDWGTPDGRIFLAGSDFFEVDPAARQIALEETYIWKMRVQTQADGTIAYSGKVWEQGQAEPVGWQMTGTENGGDPHNGSLILVAHHVDATFGNVEVVAIEDAALPPVITDVSAERQGLDAVITWVTNEPASSLLEHGETAAYGNVESDPALITRHSMTLTGLDPALSYHFRVGGTDGDGLSSTSDDQTFSLAPALISDDFSGTGIDSSIWTVVNPLGDATFATTGTQATISVPASASHSVWTDGNSLPRLQQSVADPQSFVVEAKFESNLDSDTQAQGILLEQTDGDVLRFEFRNDGGTIKLFAASILGASANIKYFQTVGYTQPMTLRIERDGDFFTISHSSDGVAFVTATVFEEALTVNDVSVYAGNLDVAHTAVIDYVFDASLPIDPEDGNASPLVVSVVGNGSVLRNPDKTTYSIGESVELTAVPGVDAAFLAWSGDLTGSLNPETIVISGATNIVANFVDTADTTPPVISSVQVSAGETSATITWSTNELADSRVDWGLTSGYGTVETDATLSTAHSITLSGLTPGTLYYFEATSTDSASNAASTGGLSFSTDFPGGGSGFQSDDFTGALDVSRWSFVDPLSDSSLTMTGSGAEIFVPGTLHDVWVGDNSLPRLRQTIANGDFEVEVGFDTASLGSNRSQGILIEQDDVNVIRVEFHDLGSGPELFIASIFGSTGTILGSMTVPSTGAGPMFLRVTRNGDDFEVFYSIDGTTFVSALSFTQGMTATGISFYAGNWSGSDQTVLIDYAFDVANPIVPEDGDAVALIVNPIGNGSVTVDPVKAFYEEGDIVTLTAVADVDWAFDFWAGDAAGNSNPNVVTVSGITVVDAHFIQVDDTQAPVVSGILVTPMGNGAMVTWTTNELADSRVDYGLTASYGVFEFDATPVTSHSLELPNLTPDTLYHLEISSQDAMANVGTSGDISFTTPPPRPSSGFVSDDFSGSTLDTGLWTFVDPLSDATATVTGSQVELFIPGALAHDAWVGSNTVPRIRQSIVDGDFSVEVKFETDLELDRSQGILVEQDDLNFVRVEFHDLGSGPQLYVATVFGGSGATLTSFSLPATGDAPMFLRVERAWDDFEVFYSLDGVSFVSVLSFTQPMTATGVSVHGGNWSGSDKTVLIDYVFDTASPIVPEDGNAVGLVVNPVGNGSVTLDPDKPIYVNGDIVELTAVPGVDWAFDGWGGAASGSSNPTTITVSGITVVDANFVQVSDTQPPVVSNVLVTPTQTGATVTWSTDEVADSRVDYGTTASYTDVASDASLLTSHSLTLTGLASDTLYHFEASSQDAAGNVGGSGDLTFTTLPGGTSGFQSDDFAGPTLDTGIWTFIDPLSDASVTMTGTQAQIDISAANHNTWAGFNTLPRLQQSFPDEDFEIEAKFETTGIHTGQSQGILIEEDDVNLIRFELNDNGEGPQLFIANIFGNKGTIRQSILLPSAEPIILRARRTGNLFEFFYSLDDGATFVSALTQTKSMSVNALSLYAGNWSGTAETVVIDYAFDTADPIVPEDGSAVGLFINVTGSGAVTLSPDKPSYVNGEIVQLTAVPGVDWAFDSWGGAAAGTSNPTTVTVSGMTIVDASFIQIGDTQAPVITNVVVTPTSGGATLTWDTNEPSDSQADYGLTSTYTDSVYDASLVTSHSLTLTGLAPETLHHVELSSQDVATNVGSSGDLSFTTLAAGGGAFQSDDFAGPTLDTGIWTFIDPLSDASVTMTGTQAQIDISAANHNTWAGFNTLPRLQQSFPDEDFEIDAKFETTGLHTGQSQGILIEEDDVNLIRFELNDNGEGPQLFIANIFGNKGTIQQSILLPSAEPIILRARRTGNLFEFFYSLDDGATFVSALTQTKSMSVNALSLYAGNWSGAAETVVIDYAFDTADPIVPEDGSAVGLFINVTGSGAVTLNPDKPAYVNGDIVELTAVPGVDWAFDSWGGAAAGTSNPTTVTVSGMTIVDASFIQIGDTQAPVITNVVVTPTSGGATLTWDTNEPSDSQADYGLTSTYTDSAYDASLVTSHSLTLTGLAPETLHHVELSSQDVATNVGSSGDLSFTTLAAGGGAFQSDDFAGPTLDTGIWTFIDPLSDASVTMTGTQAQIDISAANHNTWAGFNTLPRLQQSFPDEDFEIEVKFETTGLHTGQSQGILIEEDDVNLIRFELNDNGEGPQLFIANIFGNKGTIQQSILLPSAEPIILRARRTGDLFEFFYSLDDGATFVSALTQTKSMSVNALSLYAGNWSGTAETVVIDYAFDTADPIVPEDGSAVGLFINVTGSGTVTLDPDKPSYVNGDIVELTAVPGVDWAFDSWGGAAAGTSNPTTITVSGMTIVDASFIQIGDTQAPVITNVVVTPTSGGATLTWDTNEPSDSQADYGLTSTYTDSVYDASLVTSHSLTLTGLAPETLHHVELSSQDAATNVGSSGDLSFTTLAAGGGAFVSDDFTGPTLDTGIWTFIDPLGDASVTMTGTQAQIDISSANHNTWAGFNTLPRLQQSFPDEDFEIEAKFETTGIHPGQSQGILIEEDDVNLIRFELNDNGEGPQLFIANIFGNKGTIRQSILLPSAEPIILRARRTGDLFEFFYSLDDGATFVSALTQTKSMSVNALSLYAGNWSGTAETVVIDYAIDLTD